MRKINTEIIDIEFSKKQYNFRFFNFFDERSREFEEKLRQNPLSNYVSVDDSGVKRDISWPHLSFWQSYHYLDHLTPHVSPFYVLQMTNLNTKQGYQIAIHAEVSKIQMFQIGTIPKWIIKTDHEAITDQIMLIEELLHLCKTYTKLMSLRIQPYMPGYLYTDKIIKMLSPFGFNSVAPKSYVKTRIFDLRPSTEEIMRSFSSNGRARLKAKEKYERKIAIKEIDDVESIPHLQKALNDSYTRSSNEICTYDFSPLFLCMSKFKAEIMMLGFYLKETLEVPKAFITGIGHGNVVEFSVGGSLTDTGLRQFPFNHLLMWELAQEAKKNGSEFLDMGGISSGTDNDSLSGITNFKRLFPGFEFSIGEEMQTVLRPNLLFFYSVIQKTVQTMKQYILRMNS